MKRIIFITDHRFPKSDAASKYMENIISLTRKVYINIPIVIVCRSNSPELFNISNVVVYSVNSDDKAVYFWYAYRQIKELQIDAQDVVFNFMGKAENLLWLYIFLYNHRDRIITNYGEHFNREYFGDGLKGFVFFLRDAIGYSIRNKYSSALAVSSYLKKSVRSKNVLCMPPLCHVSAEYKKREWTNMRFIYPGADLNKDRIDNIIKTFLIIQRTKPEIELHLTGMKKKISSILDKNDIQIHESNRIFIYDWLNEQEYVELLSKMDFTIIIREKNQVTYANFPSKIPVLMAKGIIPIVSDVGDYTKYYLRDNDNSFVIDGSSPEVFSKEILKIVNYPKHQLESLHKCAWETAKNEFDISNWQCKFSQFIDVVDRGI